MVWGSLEKSESIQASAFTCETRWFYGVSYSRISCFTPHFTELMYSLVTYISLMHQLLASQLNIGHERVYQLSEMRPYLINKQANSLKGVKIYFESHISRVKRQIDIYSRCEDLELENKSSYRLRKTRKEINHANKFHQS